MDPRIRRTAGAAAVALLLAGCGSAPEASGPVEVTEAGAVAEVRAGKADASAEAPQGPPQWTRVAKWPGPNWGHAISAWTGREVLLIGAVEEPVPGAAHSGPPPRYAMHAAAAAYDPAHDTWRTLKRPPFRLDRASLAVADGVAYASTIAYGKTYKDVSAELYAWSPADDTWQKLPPPPEIAGRMLWGRLLAAGPTLVLAGFGEDSDRQLAYDPAARTWSRLADTPWRRERTQDVVGLPDGRLVTFGSPSYQEPWDEPADPSPRFWHAAVLDPGAREWRELPTSPITIGEGRRRGEWMLAGGLLVNAADGSLPLYDKFSYTPKGAARDAARSLLPTPPTGGVLDVDAGAWSLPADRPTRAHPLSATEPLGWLTAAAGDLAVLDGWGYDPIRRTWTEFPPAPSAPDGLGGAALVWAGDRLLAFAITREVAAPDGDGYRIEVDHVGWAWIPVSARS